MQKIKGEIPKKKIAILSLGYIIFLIKDKNFDELF